MTEREALFRNIVEHPQEDLPRLIFADWLEEQGEAIRADFIRAELAVEHLPRYHPDRLRHRFIEKPRLEKLLPLPELPTGSNWIGPPYCHRGLPDGIEINFSHLASPQHQQIFQTHPIRRLSASIGSWPIEHLTQSAWKNQLESLELQGAPIPEQSFQQLRVTEFPALKTLAVRRTALTPNQISRLMQSQLFFKTQGFELDGINLAEIEVDGVAGPNLENFDGSTPYGIRVSYITVTDNAPRTLTDLYWANALTEIDLTGNLVGLIGWADRYDHYFLRPVNLLKLSDAPRSGWNLIEALDSIDSLHELELVNSSIDNRTLRSIAKLLSMEELVCLNLSGNPIGTGGVSALLGFSGLRSVLKLKDLRVLILRNTQLTDTGAQQILESPLADQLVFLDLRLNDFSIPMMLKLDERFGDRIAL